MPYCSIALQALWSMSILVQGTLTVLHTHIVYSAYAQHSHRCNGAISVSDGPYQALPLHHLSISKTSPFAHTSATLTVYSEEKTESTCSVSMISQLYYVEEGMLCHILIHLYLRNANPVSCHPFSQAKCANCAWSFISHLNDKFRHLHSGLVF